MPKGTRERLQAHAKTGSGAKFSVGQIDGIFRPRQHPIIRRRLLVKKGIGSDNVIIGSVSDSIGDRNVVINVGDANGNLTVNRGGTAIGAGARADSTSIAIGAGAMAGDMRHIAISQLGDAVRESGEPDLIQSFGAFVDELNRAQPRPDQLKRLFEAVRTLAAAGKLAELAAKAGAALGL